MPYFSHLRRTFSSLNCQRANVASPPSDLLPSEIERLESRMMLAGDVTFNVSGGNLTVKGTGGDDCVEVGSEEGEITVNGEFTGIRTRDLNNLTIKTLAGNDEVVVGIDVGGNLKIVTKNGEDYVQINNTEVNGKTTIKTGNDGDVVNTLGSTYVGKVKIVTGSGSDEVGVAIGQLTDEQSAAALQGVYGENLNVSFESLVKVKLGSDDDQLNLGSVSMDEPGGRAMSYGGFVSFGDGASANGGSGEDFFSIARKLIDPDSIPSDASVQAKNFETPTRPPSPR